MEPATTSQRRPRYRILAIAAVMTALITGGCMSTDDSVEPMPERDFDESTAWIRMEEAAAEAIADLPDFPGFERRKLMDLTCSSNGKIDEDYIQFELTYTFSAEDSATDLVHEDYVGLLREQWTAAGYDIHRDEIRGKEPTQHYIMEAERPDGINYWLRAANFTSLTIQSGCVKKSEMHPDCPPPLGGVLHENDIAGRQACGGNYDEPTGEAEAIAPFDGAQTAISAFSTKDTATQDDDFDLPTTFNK